jgi:hypothetical protein
LIQSSQISKSSDFSTVLSLLSAIAPTFTRVEVSHEDAKEFEKSINSFLFEEGAGVIQMIRQLPETQIKDLKEDDILNVIKAYYEANEKTLGKEEYLAKAQLDMLLVFLQSPYIDKKLTALNEIKKMFDKRNKLKEVSPKTLANWLAESKVIEYIYQEAKHPELISRSADLIIILAENNKLKEETLEMLWETCINEHKHEAVTEATLNVIASIAKSLDSKMIDIFLEHIHRLPLHMLGEYIAILKLFYINCFENFRMLQGKSRAEKDMAEKVKLENLWKAVQDDATLSEKNKLITLDVLIELMHMFDLSNTSQFLGYAVESLKEGNSSVKCMIMIEKVLNGCIRRGYPAIFKKEDLVGIAIQAAEIYLNNARDNSPMDGRNIEDMVFSGNSSHKETIARYFKFISFLLMKFDGHNKLTNEHIDYMFKVFVKESISKVERGDFYKFLTFDEFDVSNSENKRIANTKSREYLFKNILCKELNSNNTGTSEFECFETNFFTVNLTKKNLKREQNEQVFRTVSMDLEGLDMVWDFSIFSPDEKIRKQCNDFLGDLYLCNEKENYIKRGENNSTFLEGWLEKILTIDEYNKQSIANILRLLFSFVKRYDGHHMDTEVFEKYDYDLTVDYQDHPKDKPKTRLMKVNKEMTIGAIRKRIGDFYNIIPSEILIVSSRSYLSECCMNDKLSAYRECKNINVRRRTVEERELELPRYLAASNLQVIQQVIEKGLESENHSLRCEALQFFEYIPTNIDRREKMIKCKKLAKKNDVESWLDFLYSKSIEKQGLYYGLKVMHSILESPDKYMTKKETEVFIETKRAFIKKFNELEGFPLLVETLNSLNLENMMKDVVWMSIFQILIRILELLIQENDSSKDGKLQYINSVGSPGQKSRREGFLAATSKLVMRVTEVLYTLSKNVTLNRDLSLYLFTPEEVKTVSEDKMKNIKEEYEILETDFYSYLIKLLKDCLFINPEEIKLFYASDFVKDGLIINLLALHPNHNTMKKFSESMRDFCWSLKVCRDIVRSPVHFFIEMFSKELKTVLSYGVLEYTEFFNFWDQLIRLLSAKDFEKGTLNIIEVGKIDLLYQTIISRSIVEDDVKQDAILSGCLKMLATFDELFGSVRLTKLTFYRRQLKKAVHQCTPKSSCTTCCQNVYSVERSLMLKWRMFR